MESSVLKRVLIIDDKDFWKERFARWFAGRAKRRDDCPYAFCVDAETTLDGGIERIREAVRCNTPYDVVVFDLLFHGSDDANPEGLQGVMGFGLTNELIDDLPVIIVFTGHPTFLSCVDAMRNGAWDYIVKEDRGDKPAPQVVADSAIDRLLELDLRRTLREEVSVKWYPNHSLELEESHSGQLVALWHQPEVHVIASGRDSFDLDVKLQPWRSNRPSWHQPFILRVQSPPSGDGSEAVT
jgi:ActR/RegA family two-component response regulator